MRHPWIVSVDYWGRPTEGERPLGTSLTRRKKGGRKKTLERKESGVTVKLAGISGLEKGLPSRALCSNKPKRTSQAS